jgi:hypothetical protein
MALSGEEALQPKQRWKVSITDRYTDSAYVCEIEATSVDEVREKMRPWYGQRVDAIELTEEDVC